MEIKIKFRLIKDNKIVGYERHRQTDDGFPRMIVEHCHLNGKQVFIHKFPDDYIQHDEKLQYIGLKDKNGKEIYEKDIVKKGKNKNSLIAKVEFGKHKVIADNPFGWGKDIPSYWGIGYGFYFYGFYNEAIGTNFCEIEVIGNKFKNPDLYQKIVDYKQKEEIE